MEHEYVRRIIELQNGDINIKWYITQDRGTHFPKEADVDDIVGGIVLEKVEEEEWGKIVTTIRPHYQNSKVIIQRKQLKLL